MAELDTGLGWAADSLWLKYNQDTVLAELGSFASSLDNTQPLPQISDPNEVYAKGKLIANRQNGFSIVYAACAVGTEGIVFISSEQNNYVQFFSPNRDFTLYIGTVLNGNPQGVASYTGTSYSPNYQIYGYIGTAPIYYSPAWAIYIHESEIINIPRVTKQVMFDSLSLDTYAITKSTEGYAVAALAKWKTGAGVIINTPVLISSVSENTDMTLNDASHYIAKLNILRDGVLFYMSFFDITDTTPVSSQLPLLDLSGPDEPARSLETIFAYVADLDHAAILVLNSPDPYGKEGGESGEEGGGGDEDPEDDPVEEETLPLPAVSGLGFSTIYVPTANDLHQLASYLWSGNLDLDNFLRLFANPMDSILGLSAVPVALSGTNEPIYLGGQLLQGVTMPRYTGRTAVKVDMGTTTISKRWGSYLDYDPYTEFSVYLPFIGIKNIKADDIMGKTVSLMYNIDILSGACVAYLRASGGSVLYEWAGQCAMQIPITGSNWDNIFSTAISAAVTLGGAMTAPASAPMLAGSVASAAVQAVAAKPRVERSGAVTGVTGFLGQLRPYIIRTIPEAYIPNDQNKFIGYPSYISASLRELTGYNEVASIHLENIPATGDELTELESILKGGVIF